MMNLILMNLYQNILKMIIKQILDCMKIERKNIDLSIQPPLLIVDFSGSPSNELDFSDCIEKCCCFPVNGLCNKELECYGSEKCRLDDVLEYCH
jgi:hypothetical protein